MSLDLATVKRVAPLAYEAGRAAKAVGSVGGCGRVYVEVGKVRKGSKVAKAFESAGFKMFPRPYHTGLRIYVGYDNATGYEWNRGELIAASLKENGIPAYVDGDGD